MFTMFHVCHTDTAIAELIKEATESDDFMESLRAQQGIKITQFVFLERTFYDNISTCHSDKGIATGYSSTQCGIDQVNFMR